MRRALLLSLLTLAPHASRAAPDGRYQVTDAIVRDRVTKLVWERTPAACQAPDPMTGDIGCDHMTAVAYCDLLVLAGASDWRLPTKYELASLWDYDSQALIATPFGGLRPATYWSSSTWYFGPPYDFRRPFAVDTFYGSADVVPPTALVQVRCVRGPAED